MDIPKLEEFLHEYSEIELFYKEYHQAKNNKDTLKIFLDNIDMDFMNKNHITLPDFNLNSTPLLFCEDYFFYDNLNLYFSKHHRYSPKFLHEHIFFEMIYVYSGTCTHMVNSVTSTLNEGDLCIIAPYTTHTIEVFDDSIVINVLIKKSTFDKTFFNLLKDNNILSKFFIDILYSKNYKNHIIFHTNNDIRLKNILLNAYIECLNNDKYSKNITNSLLSLFFSYLLKNHENDFYVPQLKKHNSKDFNEIILYIKKNHTSVTLEELSEIFHFSTCHLSRLIKSQTGFNFTTLVRNIKLDYACEYLKTTNLSIKSISELIGYSSQEHFIRVFKKEFKISPTQYRKNNISL